MASKSTEEIPKTLSTLFKEGLDLYNNLGKIDEPTNSLSVQLNVKKAMHSLESATRLVSLTDLFSKNETIDEIATEDLQYMLLPALLGSLSLKLTTGERKDIIDTAEVYFKDFLQRSNNYGMSNYSFKESDPTSSTAVATMEQSEFDQIKQSVNTRASKIERFREHKHLQSQLAEMKQVIDTDHADEEIKRKYYLSMIKLYIYEAMDELRSIEMEKPILDHMSQMGGTNDKPKPKRPVQPLKPIIITRDEMQKAVYGAGYPSLPTMTVQEFYDKRVRDGIFPDPTKPKPPSSGLSMQEAALAGVTLNDSDTEDEKKEQLVETDDDENLARLRAKDEFKDDHRRGWGNRMNRS